jgi:hypothetical protein
VSFLFTNYIETKRMLTENRLQLITCGLGFP